MTSNLLTQHPFVCSAIAVPLCLYAILSFLAPSFNYKGKHVMITGGSSGIGFEVVHFSMENLE